MYFGQRMNDVHSYICKAWRVLQNESQKKYDMHQAAPVGF